MFFRVTSMGCILTGYVLNLVMVLSFFYFFIFFNIIAYSLKKKKKNIIISLCFCHYVLSFFFIANYVLGEDMVKLLYIYIYIYIYKEGKI